MFWSYLSIIEEKGMTEQKKGGREICLPVNAIGSSMKLGLPI